MKIAIIGTGAVGGYFGGMLAKAGNDVTFLARGEHLKAIQTIGLTIKTINGNFIINPAKATDKIKDIDSPDMIILGVKAWQIKEIAPELSEIIKTETVILPLQNGVLAVDELKEYINPENIICGLCRIISMIESPGVILHSGVEPEIVFGEMDNLKTERVIEIKNLFDKAGIKSRIADDIQADLLEKIHKYLSQRTIGSVKLNLWRITSTSTNKAAYDNLMTEIYTLSQKIGIKIKPDFIDKTMAFVDTYPAGSTSSLTRDVWAGKPSEIEYQNGTVVRLAEKYGIDTPINRFVYYCILPSEIRARRKT